jgi:AsmA protein
MRLKVPFLGYALAGIAFLLPSILLTAFLPFLINAQPFRAKLLRELGHWTGGEVKVAGAISVRDFFSLSIEAQNVEIGRFKTAAPIEGIRAQRVVARIAWFNLLSGNFNFDKVKVHRAVVRMRGDGPADTVDLLAGVVFGRRDTPFDAFQLDRTLVALRSVPGRPYRRLRVESAIANTSKSGRQLNASAAVVWKDLPARVTMRVAFRARSTARLPLRLSLESDLLSAGFNGEAALDGPIDAEGAVTLRAPHLAAAAEWLELDFGPAAIPGAVAASGDLTVSAEQATLTSAEISIAGQAAKTALTLKQGSTLPRLEGVLAFERFDPAPLLDTWAQARDSARPLRIPVESDLRISAKTMSWNGIEAGPAALAVTSRAERITAEIAELGFLGGEMRGHLALDVTGKQPRISARLTGESLDAAGFLSLTRQRDWLSGQADVNVEAESAFDHPSDISQNVMARARVNFPEGGQMRLDIPRIAASALGESSGWDALDLTSAAFDRLRFDVTLRQGQISFANVVLAAAGRQVNGRGDIDLAARSLDWRLNLLPTIDQALVPPAASSQEAGASASRLSIKGPWSSPTIRKEMSPASLLKTGSGKAGLEVSLSGR